MLKMLWYSIRGLKFFEVIKSTFTFFFLEGSISAIQVKWLLTARFRKESTPNKKTLIKLELNDKQPVFKFCFTAKQYTFGAINVCYLSKLKWYFVGPVFRWFVSIQNAQNFFKPALITRQNCYFSVYNKRLVLSQTKYKLVRYIIKSTKSRSN